VTTSVGKMEVADDFERCPRCSKAVPNARHALFCCIQKDFILEVFDKIIIDNDISKDLLLG